VNFAFENETSRSIQMQDKTKQIETKNADVRITP